MLDFDFLTKKREEGSVVLVYFFLFLKITDAAATAFRTRVATTSKVEPLVKDAALIHVLAKMQIQKLTLGQKSRKHNFKALLKLNGK